MDRRNKRKIRAQPHRTYYYKTWDKDDNLIEPAPTEIEARDLSHALQKIAACLPDNATEVNVWQKGLDHDV